MALSTKEQKLFDELKQRAENAEAENKDLVEANDEANVKIAEAAIEKQEAVDQAIEESRISFEEKIASAGGKPVDKSISPEKPMKFNRDAYFSECMGGDAHYVQNGWYYDNAGKPVRPVNK